MFILKLILAAVSLGHADGFNCRATCVVLQTGPRANEEIQARARPYDATTRLVKNLGPVFAFTLEDLRAICTEWAHDVDWWHPPGDAVTSELVTRIDVDDSDEVMAVRSYQAYTTCAGPTSN